MSTLEQRIVDVIEAIAQEFKKRGTSNQPTPTEIPVEYYAHDTGWYDVTELTAKPIGTDITGKVFLRRVGNTVYVQFDNYKWSKTGSIQNFFNTELTKYIHPTVLTEANNGIFRAGTAISTGDRGNTAHSFDWLRIDNCRLNCYVNVPSFGLVSWITDTPFPSNLLGTKVTEPTVIIRNNENTGSGIDDKTLARIMRCVHAWEKSTDSDNDTWSDYDEIEIFGTDPDDPNDKPEDGFDEIRWETLEDGHRNSNYKLTPMYLGAVRNTYYLTAIGATAMGNPLAANEININWDNIIAVTAGRVGVTVYRDSTREVEIVTKYYDVFDGVVTEVEASSPSPLEKLAQHITVDRYENELVIKANVTNIQYSIIRNGRSMGNVTLGYDYRNEYMSSYYGGENPLLKNVITGDIVRITDRFNRNNTLDIYTVE